MSSNPPAKAPEPTAPKLSRNDRIISYRKKSLKRAIAEGSTLTSGKAIRQNLPPCPCHEEKGLPNPCTDCVEFVLEKKNEHTIRVYEMKLDAIDKANTNQVRALKQQLANHDHSAIEKLRKTIVEKDAELEKWQQKFKKMEQVLKAWDEQGRQISINKNCAEMDK